jgi:hypothetical protein
MVCVFSVAACVANGTPSDDTTGGDYSGSATIGDPGDNGGGDTGSGTMTGSDGDDEGGDGSGGMGSGAMGSGAGSGDSSVEGLTSPSCTYGPDIYSPFAGDSSIAIGPVAAYPWWNAASSSAINFSQYNPGETVECGSNKSQRSYLDVTAGCLGTATFQGNTRGVVHMTSAGYYRSFALPTDENAPGTHIKWTDQVVEYDFYYSQWTGTVSNPGFKAFARYLDEYDLYVGSWRRDGVVQIQKKECGTYTTLKRIANYGAPTPNQWHHIKFETKGDDLKLYLDGTLAVEIHDKTFGAGTAGIRIDDLEGAYIDNWHVGPT